MKAAFVVNARNKAAHIAKAVQGAIAQTYPCHIILSDQHSTDGTFEAMEAAAAATPMPMVRVAEPPEIDLVLDRDVKEVPLHKVDIVRCPIEGAYGMLASNQHVKWLAEQTDAEWIFQCSADDWSLPDRVRLCMEAIAKNPCVAVATNMRMFDPEKPDQDAYAGVAESSYVSAGFGLQNLVFGSMIAGYKRDWLLSVGIDKVSCTLDVYLGALAALNRGFYAVASVQHTHYMAADLDNMGFQGKMRAAEKDGDKSLIVRINELNRFQLFELYYLIKVKQQELYPLAHQEDQGALVNMMLTQACGLYQERKKLHDMKVRPDIL